MAVEDLAAEAPGSFDVVTCVEMLEHVPDPQSVVRARHPGETGRRGVFSTLNRNPENMRWRCWGRNTC